MPRSWAERTKRKLLRQAMLSPLFGPAMRLGQAVRGALPQALRRKVPERRDPGRLPQVAGHARQVLMLAGCVQPSMMPTIDAATIRVLDALGIGARIAPGAGCCGAVSFHLDEQDAALAQMRANIDAWWPLVRDGRVEAIVMNASGCGAMVKEYAHHLRNDPAYAQRAADIVALVRTWPRSSRRRRRRYARACRKRRARPFIRRARCSIGRACGPCRSSCWRTWDSNCSRSPTSICAAARPGRIRC